MTDTQAIKRVVTELRMSAGPAWFVTALNDWANKLEAAIQSDAQSAGWRTIDSAPKDGSKVLLLEDEFVLSGNWAFWHLLPPSWRYDLDTTGAEYPPNPTHWMPMPSAPTKELP